jgi:RNA polymerase sigma factor (sigma-70 family)
MTKNANLKAEEEKKLLTMAKKALELNKNGEKVPPRLLNAVKLLIFHNQNLVKYIARGYSLFSGVDYDDLVSAGIESLPKAIEKFNLDSEWRFATYAGHWVRQYFQSFINKSQFINQSSKVEGKKSIVFYDNHYQNDDKENSKSYSLIDTLADSEDSKMGSEDTRQRDIMTQINILVNLLETREAIFLIRLLYKVVPSNLLDIYYISTKEEKEELKNEMKLGKKKNVNILQNYSLSEKKISNLPVVKNYLEIFSHNYKFSELTKLISKSENSARRLKQESFKKLQELAKERNLHFLID